MPPVKIRGRAKKGTINRLLKQLFKRYPGRLIFSGICVVFNVIGNLCSSIFVGLVTGIVTRAIETKVNPFDISARIEADAMGGTFHLATNATILLIIMGVMYVIGIIATWGWNRTMALTTHEFLNDFRKAMFNHMEDLPVKYFDTHKKGDIMSLYTNDIDTIRQFISQTIPEFLRTTLSVLFCLALLIVNSIWITLIVVLCTIAMSLNTKVIGGISAKYFIKAQRQVGVVEGNIQESINGLKVIKVFTHEEESIEQFEKINEELRQYQTEANMKGNITMPINGNIGNFMYVLAAVVCCLLLVLPDFKNLTITGFKEMGNSETSLDAFLSMVTTSLMMCRMFTNNVAQLSQHVTFIVMSMAGASRCFDIMDEQAEADDGYVTLVNCNIDEKGNITESDKKTGKYAWKHPHKADETVTYTELKGDIILDQVDFSYDGKKIVLNDVSVYAHPGQQVALVGATGAGKTTITNLINRFYDIKDGKVRYDGININKIKKADLRRSLGIVLQDTNLFTGTVMENIRYGKLDATDEEVYEAAKIANAYDFITRLPEGFNTMLTGDGANLSQGQRQLLSIARAAVADAPVMILDEATSSIDTRTEKLVQEGMDKIMHGRTVFVIAHRLSTVQNSDVILVLDKGNVIEKGNHNSLIEQKGTYYQLYTGAFELE
ncbi:MAG: ABC transporter ATP-binding protein/permease [Bacilli bacterium]|nr:ABC transporter ATP-binding protein/permease [Bacilli bacterium]